MAQRVSGYERLAEYCTPQWVTAALIPHLPHRPKTVWEPASGSASMLNVLRECLPDSTVVGSDVSGGVNFLNAVMYVEAVITNPPYEAAEQFIAHALRLTRPGGFVAMLLRCDYDHAHSRRYLFADNPAFTKRLALTKRIRWFAGSTGSPSYNHSWFVWNHKHEGAPVTAYGP
jgi:hypothetical protein